MQLNGYVKVYRKLLLWGWYKNSVVKDTFLHLIFTANFKDAKWENIVIKRGQLITSYGKIADELGFSIQQVRTAIKKLNLTGEINSSATNKYQLITVVNFDDYQGSDDENNSFSTLSQQSTNSQITFNQQQRNNIKNKNNVNNNTDRSHKYGEYENVLLNDDEFEKLKSEFFDINERIDRLSGYIESTGKKYKSHYATIRNWAKRDICSQPEEISYDLEKINKRFNNFDE